MYRAAKNHSFTQLCGELLSKALKLSFWCTVVRSKGPSFMRAPCPSLEPVLSLYNVNELQKVFFHEIETIGY